MMGKSARDIWGEGRERPPPARRAATDQRGCPTITRQAYSTGKPAQQHPEPRLTKKSPHQKQLDAVLAAVRKRLERKDAAVQLSRGTALSEVSEVIPTGLSALDHYLLGPGGLPIGRSSEWAGASGSGKTTLVLEVLARAMAAGGIGIYGDAEQSFDAERFQALGGDPERLVLVQGDTLEEYAVGMNAAMNALTGELLALVAYDSIGGSTSQAELEGDYSGDAMGKKAGLIGKMVRGLSALAPRKRAHVMFVNQLRKKVGVSFGDPTYSPGGDAPQYTCSIRIRVYGGRPWKIRDGTEVGKHPTFQTMKNRHAPPRRKVEARLNYLRGFEEVWTTVNHAKDLKLGILEDAALASQANYDLVMAKLGWRAPRELRTPEQLEVEAAVEVLEKIAPGEEPQE